MVACGNDSIRRAEILAENTHLVDVDVIAAHSRRAGLERATSEWVLFLDDDDVPDEAFLDALVVAQAASGADAVTAAVRPAEKLGSRNRSKRFDPPSARGTPAYPAAIEPNASTMSANAMAGGAS